MRANGGDGVWEGDTGQTSAALERVCTDGGDGVGDDSVFATSY